MSEQDTNKARTLHDVGADIAEARKDLDARIMFANDAAAELRLVECERWLSDARESVVRLRGLQTEAKLIAAQERM